MGQVVWVVFIGTGATAFTDLWAIVRQYAFGVPAPNFGLVGRWIAHMPRGRFRHASISATAPARGEALIGWSAHYLIGIAFAALLLSAFGNEWARRPTIGPALLIGIVTIAAPFLIMQPGMGAGLAARRTPRPGAARLHSLVTHAMFGAGLYVSARVAQTCFS